MNGLIHYKRTLKQLMFVPLMLLYGCASAPEDMPLQMTAALIAPQNQPQEEAIVAARKLNFVFEYKQVTLTANQQKRLLYLYDWQDGTVISYGKASAENDYIALAIGHQRVHAVIKALDKNNKVIQINYDPTLAVDSVLIEENIIHTTGASQNTPAGLLKSTRL